MTERTLGTMRRVGLLRVCVLALAGCAGGGEADAPDPALAERLQALAPRLRHDDPMQRRVAADVIGVLGPAATPLLAEALQVEPDAGVRFELVRAVGRADGPKATAPLRAVASRDADVVGVRLAAVHALGTLPPEDAAPALAALAVDPGMLGRAARLALGLAGGPAAAAFFRSGVDRAGVAPLLRRELVAGLVRLAELSDVPRLRRLAADADPAIRREAGAALGRLGGPAAVTTLQTLRADADRGVRKVAAAGLWRAGSPAVASR